MELKAKPEELKSESLQILSQGAEAVIIPSLDLIFTLETLPCQLLGHEMRSQRKICQAIQG